MVTEKRKAPRVNSHILTEISLPGEFPKYCGYVENLSECGIGLISLDSFQVGAELNISFVLPGTVDRVTTVATVVRAEPSVGMLHYYAFTLDKIDEADCRKIARYIRESAA